MGAQIFFSKQDGFGYFQGGRGHRQSKWKEGRDRFRRKHCESLNMLTGQPHKANQSTSYANNGNPKSRFDK